MLAETGVILANFGGPRHLNEVKSFLTELLTDADVMQTGLPRFLEKWLFTKIASRRSGKIAHDYAYIGGKSPIFEDTETVAASLREKTGLPILTFHRYLPQTYADFFRAIRCAQVNKFIVVPLYPQFSYSTTGSIARFFSTQLPSAILQKMEWVRSYPADPSYVQAMCCCIQDYLSSCNLKEEDVFLFFSAHGLPQKFVERGDPYAEECHKSYTAIRERFPKALSLLAFQSKFGPGKWLHPYTSELSQNPTLWNQGRKDIVFIPLSFTSDHLETLFEIETTYLPNIRQKNLNAYRCPALNRRDDWIEALASLLEQKERLSNDKLVRV